MPHPTPAYVEASIDVVPIEVILVGRDDGHHRRWPEDTAVRWLERKVRRLRAATVVGDARVDIAKPDELWIRNLFAIRAVVRGVPLGRDLFGESFAIPEGVHQVRYAVPDPDYNPASAEP